MDRFKICFIRSSGSFLMDLPSESFLSSFPSGPSIDFRDGSWTEDCEWNWGSGLTFIPKALELVLLLLLLLLVEFWLSFLLFNTESRGMLLVMDPGTFMGFKVGDCVGVESGVS